MEYSCVSLAQLARLVGVSDYDNHAIGIPHTQSARTADYANPHAWKSYPGAGLTDNGGGKAMYLSFTSFSRRSTETGGDGTLPNKNGGFRFNAAEGSGSIGATGTGDLDNGYVRGVKDEQ